MALSTMATPVSRLEGGVIKKPDLDDYLRTLEWMAEHYGFFPDYEAILRKGYERLVPKGGTVIDVGANKGDHVAPLLEAIGETGVLYGFEPIPALFRRLRKIYRRDRRVTFFQAALAAAEGTSSFVLAVGDEAESGLKQRVFNRPDRVRPKTITVVTKTLDQTFPDLKQLDYIKIDIEGGEIDCLRGGAGLINRLRPPISVEYGAPSYRAYGNEARTLFDLAESWNYRIVDLFGTPLSTLDLWLSVCDCAYWDYWLVPLERLDQVVDKLALQS